MNKLAFHITKLNVRKEIHWRRHRVSIIRYESEILGVLLPDQLTVTVNEAEEAVQGNSVQNATKRAWLASGWDFQVPQFIKSGEKVIINSADGQYVGRAK